MRDSTTWNESTAPLLPEDCGAAEDAAALRLSPTALPSSLESESKAAEKPRGCPTLFYILAPIVVLLPLLFASAAFLPAAERRSESGEEPPTGPARREPAPATLPSVVDADGGPVGARRNGPRDRLKRGAFLERNRGAETGDSSPFVLRANRDEIGFGQELRLSWRRRGDPDAFRGGALVALHCSDDEADGIRSEDLRDAVALPDADAGEWIIPSFPVVGASRCRFSLLRPILDDSRSSAGGERYETLASASVSLAAAQEVPAQIHLGLSSAPDSYYVQFATGLPGSSVVEIARKGGGGSAPTPTWTRLTGSSVTYGAEEMCRPPADEAGPTGFGGAGHFHTVLVEGLEGGARYVYRCGLGMGQGVRWSEYFEFVTAKSYDSSSNQEEGPVTTFLALGDQGTEQSDSTSPEPAFDVRPGRAAARDVVELIYALTSDSAVSSVHHLGDLSYADGASHLWDAYLTLVSRYAARVPMTVGVGNHEYDHDEGGEGKDPSGEEGAGGFRPFWGDYGDDSGGECGVPISRRFAGPENGNGVYWYSFDQPLVHTIMLSTEHNMTADSPQYQWLLQDLQSVNRTVTPWLVVEMHRPMYDRYQEDDAVAVAIQYEIEDLLYEYNVDLVLTAHFHAYLRTCDGLFRGKCDSGGPMHITVGTGGAPLDGGTRANSPWIEKYDGTHWGVGKASILDATTLHWEFVVVGGGVEDEVTIRRSR